MKKLCFLLAALLLLGCLAGCGGIDPESEPSDAGKEIQIPADAEILPDFTVETVDGSAFTLSEALEDHELVLINLWATWCPPCRMEFPYLQEAWEQEKDRVAVVALSIDPDDTDEMLRDFVSEMGLTFPVGREAGTDLSRFVDVGIPTTILVDRTGKVAAVEVGAKSSTREFLDLFDDYSGKDYDPAVCTYTVCCYGVQYGEDIEGVVINFCTDTACTPVTTSASGAAVFTGPPAKYHVQIVKSPEGWEPVESAEFYTEPYGQTFWIPFAEAGR